MSHTPPMAGFYLVLSKKSKCIEMMYPGMHRKKEAEAV
jgi:hypothetical protein